MKAERGKEEAKNVSRTFKMSEEMDFCYVLILTDSIYF